MSIGYKAIKVQAALKLAQIKGVDQATLEAAYTGAWASALDGAEIPLSAFRDQILMIEKTFAQEIGNNPAHPARTLLYGRSSNLTNLASTPSTDNNGTEFLGVFDSCADGNSNAPLTWQPTQTLADVANSFFSDTDLYYYNITGNQLRISRPTAYLQGVVWNMDDQLAEYNADGSSPLPEYLANGWVAGVVASSAQVGWTDAAGVSAYDMQLYQQTLASLRSTTHLPLSSQANPAAG